MSAVREVSSLDLPSSSSSCRPMLSSALLIERRLTALIGQLGRGFGYRDSGLVNNPINLPTQGQIGTGAACRHSTHVRQYKADHFVRGADRFVQRDQLPLLLGNAEPDQFGLRPPENQRSPRRAVTASSRASSIAGRQRGPDRAESRHLAAGSRLRLRACRCRSGCQIKVPRQCRRADGGGLSGPRSRDNGDGLSHRVRSCCVAARYSDCSIRANGGG